MKIYFTPEILQRVIFLQYFSLRIFPYSFCPFKFPTNARSIRFMFYYIYIYIIYIFTCCVHYVHFYPFKSFTNLDLPSTSPENIRFSINSANVVDSSKFIRLEASQTIIIRAIYFERSITSHRTYTLRSFTFQINYTFPSPFPRKRGSSTNKQP